MRDGLSYGQFLMLRRNCSLKEDYFKEPGLLKNKLTERGYPNRHVRKAIKCAWFNEREELLTRTRPVKDKMERALSSQQQSNIYIKKTLALIDIHRGPKRLSVICIQKRKKHM